MDGVCAAVICALAAIAVLAVIYLFRVLTGVREVIGELDEKMKSDTNTPLTVSSGSRAVRRLAAQLNCRLRALRREQLRLKNGDAELQNAVTGVSHDLRTPLTAICGYLDLLEREDLSENAARYLAVIRERTETMRGLTEELLRYSVTLETAGTLTACPVCLNDILEQSLAGFYGAFSARGITPQVGMPREKVTRTADSAALRRVFDNILSNAARYSDGDLNILLTDDGTVCFENSAKELNEVLTKRLFDRFYTVNAASGGTGLGLSVAGLLTRKMGGDIAAEYHAGKLLIRLCFPEK